MSLQGLQLRGMLQGGVMALIASTVTRLIIQKQISAQSLLSGFAVGFAATFFTLSVAYVRGQRQRGTGEGNAWFGFVVVLLAGVVAGFLT